MPVSFSAAPHNTDVVSGLCAYTPEQLLEASSPTDHNTMDEVLQCGFSNVSNPGRNLETPLTDMTVPGTNGFVHTVIEAYNRHHALILRPDDIWLSILCQLNFHVNAHAELLRASFVSHSGRRDLKIVEVGTRHSVDFAAMTERMVGLVSEQVVDPTLVQWALPSFSTTTATDKTASSVLLLATLRQYFRPVYIATRCGIPHVTLEGTKTDWVDVLQRAEKLKEYGVEAIAWYHLLRPVLMRFVAAFDAPESKENVEFWSRVLHLESFGSGPEYYSGWINAFNAFSEKGEWIGPKLNLNHTGPESPETLTAAEFWTRYGVKDTRSGQAKLVIDDTPYHHIDTNYIPHGFTTLDVKLIDNDVEYKCAITAGMVGMHCVSSCESQEGLTDTVRPVSGWWLYTKVEEKRQRDSEMVASRSASRPSRGGVAVRDFGIRRGGRGVK
ncbi:hypothetical protein FB45DRAFT_828825 [Roridomyces roridus]|uniref:Uncharacterized protein n=1 Tax=Roridomyces roridus TaxID=1738132 RepID=A0AAD7FQ38_9AGAR|nr:hypothetical protein FB45DRAFT_828825 [Roridomyces roridus]